MVKTATKRRVAAKTARKPARAKRVTKATGNKKTGNKKTGRKITKAKRPRRVRQKIATSSASAL